MQKTKVFSFLIVLMFSFTFIACSDNRDNDNMDETSEMKDGSGTNDNSHMGENSGAISDGTQVTFWDRNREYTYTDRNTYKDDLNAAVDKLDIQIDNLENRADNATGDTKQALEKRIDNLKEKRSELKNKVNDWANITEKEWDSFKSDVNGVWDDVQDSYNELARDITGDDKKDGNY